jgi:hypothetical protein
MESSTRHARGITAPGVGVTRARAPLLFALGLLVAGVIVVWLILTPSGAARAAGAPDNAPLVPQAASTGTVIVNLNPSSSSVTKDQIFTVDIQIVAGSQPVDAAEIYLSFSQTYLQVVDAAGNPVRQIEDRTGWDTVLANAVYTDTEPAQIQFAAGIFGSGTAPTGTFSLARIHFKALKETGGGSTPLVFGTVLPHQTGAYYGAALVLGGVENGSVIISGQTPTVTPTPLMRRVFLPVAIRHR